jgi:hypothetical protein
VVPTKVRGQREMHQSSDFDLDRASPDLPIKEATSKQRLRPQGNRAAKEEHKNQKLRNATIHAQLAAIEELAEASKPKLTFCRTRTFSCSSLPLTTGI